MLVLAVFKPFTVYSSYLSKRSVVGLLVGCTVPRRTGVAGIAVVKSVASATVLWVSTPCRILG